MADSVMSQLEINPVEKRIKDLSEKVKLTADERDELAKAKDVLEGEKQAAVKEAEFYKGINPLIAKYPQAVEFQDKILGKVKLGYDIEDATISILNREGKLNSPQQGQVKTNSPIGGSAPVNIGGGSKKMNDMTRDEKRAELQAAEARGDIGLS